MHNLSVREIINMIKVAAPANIVFMLAVIKKSQVVHAFDVSMDRALGILGCYQDQNYLDVEYCKESDTLTIHGGSGRCHECDHA